MQPNTTLDANKKWQIEAKWNLKTCHCDLCQLHRRGQRVIDKANDPAVKKFIGELLDRLASAELDLEWELTRKQR